MNVLTVEFVERYTIGVAGVEFRPLGLATLPSVPNQGDVVILEEKVYRVRETCWRLAHALGGFLHTRVVIYVEID